MRRALATTLVLVGISRIALAQSSVSPPAFEIADVRVRPHAGSGTSMTGGVLRAGRYDLRDATMLDLITTAYGVEADSVLGGPRWLEITRFEIAAKAPNGTSQDTLKKMLQGLLADRFKLVLHHDRKPLPAFALTAGSGPHKLKTASADGERGCRPVLQTPGPDVMPSSVVVCRNITMEMFAGRLRDMAGLGYLPNPVADRTGLSGSWNFELQWTPRGTLAQAGSAGINIFDAVEKQLGLKLAPQTIDAPVLVVDSVNQQPTASSSGADQPLPPAPAEFEVAEIKLSAPGASPGGWRMLPGGRFESQNDTLKQLIRLAWKIGDDQLAGGPDWLDSTSYSISAIGSSAMAGSREAIQVDFEDLRSMLRALLEDRLKLKTHMEERPVSAYTLVADKPKLQPANPSDRTRCKQGPAPNTNDSRATAIPSRSFSCQNMTMAEFAGQLPSIAPGYLGLPVTDATGLQGAWNFTFTFSSIAQVAAASRAGARNSPTDQVPTALDPSDALSLFDALRKQLGLKLEMSKRPMPVLVIDHVEKKPTD